MVLSCGRYQRWDISISRHICNHRSFRRWSMYQSVQKSMSAPFGISSSNTTSTVGSLRKSSRVSLMTFKICQGKDMSENYSFIHILDTHFWKQFQLQQYKCPQFVWYYWYKSYLFGRYAAMRKLNDFIKRARQAKIHAYIIANLKDDMPKLFGKGRKKKELIKNLPALLKKIQVLNNLLIIWGWRL